MAAATTDPRRVDRAFDRVYKKHVGDVYRYALVVLGNPADAEDVTQTTFLNAYRAFLRGDQPEKEPELADRDHAQRLPPAVSQLGAAAAGGRARRPW